MLPIALVFMVSFSALVSAAARPVASATVARAVPVDIVYRSEYNIPGSKVLGWIVSQWHHFDGSKYGKAFEYLKSRGMITRPVIRPDKVTDAQLLQLHTPEYLASLKRPSAVSGIVCVPQVASMPAWAVKRYLIDPIKYATQGTIIGAQKAVETGGVVVNLGGGYHHAKVGSGEGFCVYNDVMLAIHTLKQKNPGLKVMIVDLDAHQGNGNASVLHEHFKGDRTIAIFDMYNNNNVYPNRREKFQQAAHITYDNPLGYEVGTPSPPTTTVGYMGVLQHYLPRAVKEFKPDLVIYNAGTDILVGDPLGAMQVERQAVIDRDSFVINIARTAVPEKPVPVLMVTSGGYTSESAGIIGESVAGIITHLTGHQALQPSWWSTHGSTVKFAATAVVMAGALYALRSGYTVPALQRITQSMLKSKKTAHLAKQ